MGISRGGGMKPKRCSRWNKHAGHCVALGSGYPFIEFCKGYDRCCVMYEVEEKEDKGEECLKKTR